MGKINKDGLASFDNPSKNTSGGSLPLEQHKKDEAAVNCSDASSERKTCGHRDGEDKKKRIEIRKELLADVKAAADGLKAFGLPNLSNQMINLVRRTMQNRFSVSFVGEFNHGKSTLINKLLGKDILPTGNLPTTALLTRVTDGQESSIVVTDKTGKNKNVLPLDEQSWEKLTAFNEKQGVKENDALPDGFITVTVPDGWLKKVGIDIFDTPGANDGSKKRDMEISRALMMTDGAVLCVDAQKGLMETQRAFIKDRLVATKVPFMALAITHLDLISKENRDTQVGYILSVLKSMNVDMPFIIANDVELPSDSFAGNMGVDKLKELLARWSANTERADRLETWLAANACRILEMAKQGYLDQCKVFEAKGEEREKLLTERKAAITAMHDKWDEIRKEMEARCNLCKKAFDGRMAHEVRTIIDYMETRIETSTDPRQWYEKTYKYELSNRLTAALISLDGTVSENARNDFEWLNRELATRFKVNAGRDGTFWKRTEELSEHSHGKAPELTDLAKERQKAGIKISVAVIVGTIVVGTLTGGGIGGLLGVGILGSVGVGTLMRHFSTQRLQRDTAQVRQQLRQFVRKDVPKVLEEATKDCANRLRLIYSDMVANAYQTESNWMKTQQELIEQAAKPSGDALDKERKNVEEKITEIEKYSNNLLKYIH